MNPKEPVTFTTIINENNAGMRLDLFMAKKFSYQSRHEWQNLIKSGMVLVFNRKVKSSYIIKTNDSVSFTVEDHEEPPVNSNYSILFRDTSLLIVNKPPDLPVHPAGPYRNNTLQSIIERDLGIKTFPLHRLDRETSGIIAFALSPEDAKKALSFMNHWKKKYFAIVNGIFTSPCAITLPIGPDTSSEVRKKRAAYEGAQESAETHFLPIEQYSGTSLIQALPVTGRLHQIRVHCLAMGHHIIGDRLYGEDDSLYLSFIQGNNIVDSSGMKRTALHAGELEIIHPETEKPHIFTEPLPSDMHDYIAGQKGES